MPDTEKEALCARIDELCAEVERLKGENDKLQDENARLRSCLSDDAENARMIIGENAKLREELEQWHRLTAGIELPEHPITEFKPKDLERENAKLRELVRDMWTGINRAYVRGRPLEPYQFEMRLRELGVEDE